ncbi:hypothetical protein CBLAS_0702 [Campylobacter blaseri]|uniref:Lysozyme inhibitor n=1 Tax=Campylobacter blaseri TaxID=2042961 RepID=A0A2P8R263_9BACT|nr:hypothetical protein [Campylobacter blaseri]PSM52595.1 hypothetical protein CQ405_02370 [Campylobacter blaseri]PSM54243.1 hypothetical protein CRN67_02370 [Campylobacter blaseri]QKF85893.1 hypothetical protein CBLAS_0702 [Campylobacter blaseri]
MKKIITFILTLSLASHLFGATCEDEKIKETLLNFNANTPERLPDSTVLTKVRCKDGSLEFAYDMENIGGIELSKFSDKQIEVFKDMQKNLLKDVYCLSLSGLHDHTNSIILIYSLDEKKFMEFEFKKSDCK